MGKDGDMEGCGNSGGDKDELRGKDGDEGGCGSKDENGCGSKGGEM
jgi:hypothetical protein